MSEVPRYGDSYLIIDYYQELYDQFVGVQGYLADEKLPPP